MSHDHHHDHKTCDCHDHGHTQEHGACHCHDEDHHEHHDGACCPHCEAALRGDTVISKLTVVRIFLAAALGIALLFLPLQGLPRLLAYLLPYLLIGCDVLWDAAKNIVRGRVFDEQFLMAIATLGAFAIGEYPEGVAVMLFYRIGELFQALAVGKSRRSIAALMDIRPDVAVVLRNGEEVRLSPEDVAIGETVVVRAGERIPLDGTVSRGETTVDNAALTGESLP